MGNVREVDIGRLQRLMKVMINPLDSCGEDIVPLQLAYVSWFDRLAESREGQPSLIAGARSGGSGGSSMSMFLQPFHMKLSFQVGGLLLDSRRRTRRQQGKGGGTECFLSGLRTRQLSQAVVQKRTTSTLWLCRLAAGIVC